MKDRRPIGSLGHKHPPRCKQYGRRLRPRHNDVEKPPGRPNLFHPDWMKKNAVRGTGRHAAGYENLLALQFLESMPFDYDWD